MSFQTTVNRNYTTGFAGEFAKEGPTRSIVARISPSVAPSDARSYANVFSRAFGYSGEVPATGQTLAALVPTVRVGATSFAGLLVNPKRHVLRGTLSGGTLAPSYFIPDNVEAEFCRMGILFAEVFNLGNSTLTVDSTVSLGYVNEGVTAATDATLTPVGAVVAYSGDAPAGVTPIETGRVLNTVTVPAAAAGAPVSAVTIIELTL